MAVLSIAEFVDGNFRKVTYEALSEGKRIADQMGTSLNALVAGAGGMDSASQLAEFGVEKIYVANDANLTDSLSDIIVRIVLNVVTDLMPEVIIMGATAMGKDISARLSARLDAPLAVDCVATRVEGSKLLATRAMYGGKILTEVAFRGSPKIITVRPNTMEITECIGAGEIEQISAPPVGASWTFIERKTESDKIELTEADVVVTGGRGMGSSDYAMVEELAAELNGAVGASRSAVDEGWRPVTDQVGQTGKTVSPSLYIAFGVSGAIQHLAGMQTSKVIVAVNKDPEAPIFLTADYGIVGDLFEVLPAITEAIKNFKSN